MGVASATLVRLKPVKSKVRRQSAAKFAQLPQQLSRLRNALGLAPPRRRLARTI
jgi:hypothetical protein